ncbi:ComEA family DNA-binding protein, partial [Kribbia dieselivorans]|uniref:ComEA family DNA-binding protein n=1 Tax=Kribbia dieselivorans TaxID=331526 RepID=UPI000B165E5C
LAQRASVPHAATGAASQRPAKAGAAGDERSDAAGEVAVSGGSPTAGVGGKGSPGEPGSASPPGAAAGAPGAGGKVVVHVTGQVRRPGIVTLAATDRVADAIEKAGGVKSPADTAAINLAQVVSDGQQIVVPKPGVPVAAPNSGASNSGGSAGGSDAGGAGGALVDLNAADQSMLEELPGIGPVLAERIIEWRTQQGRFTAVEELQEVTGIGEKLYAQISPKVRV